MTGDLSINELYRSKKEVKISLYFLIVILRLREVLLGRPPPNGRGRPQSGSHSSFAESQPFANPNEE